MVHVDAFRGGIITPGSYYNNPGNVEFHDQAIGKNPQLPGYNGMSAFTQNTGFIRVDSLKNVRNGPKVDFKAVYADVGDGYIIHSSRQTYKFTKSDDLAFPLTNPDDLNFKGWTAGNPIVGGGDTRPEYSILIADRKEKLADGRLNKYITPYEFHGQLKDLGMLWSKIEGVKLGEREYGVDFSHVPKRAATNNSNSGMYYVGKTVDGEMVFGIGPDASKKLYSMGKPHRVSLDAMHRRAYEEEFGHIELGHLKNFNPSLKARIAREYEVRHWLIEKYLAKAKGASPNSKERDDALAVISHLEEDIGNVVRNYSKGRSGSLRSILHEYALKQGMSTEEAAEFVESEIGEVDSDGLEAIVSEEAGNQSRSSSKSSARYESNDSLEEGYDVSDTYDSHEGDVTSESEMAECEGGEPADQGSSPEGEAPAE